MKRTLMLFALVLCYVTMFAQGEILTNQTIIDMLELGFEDDVVITKINTSKSNFDTSIQSLKSLKEKGVSSDIIVAIMKAEKLNECTESDIKKPGIYFSEGSELRKILPTVFSGTKTNTLGAAFTYGIANAKIKSIMNNSHSNNIIQTNIPNFFFVFTDEGHNNFSNGASNWWFATASSPNEFVLTKLKSKKGKRELETGRVNLYGGNTIGINEEDVIPFEIEVINDLEFKVTPHEVLEPGEYCFFYQGTIPQGGYNNQVVFDFSISENCKAETKFKNGDYVWIIKGGKARSYEIASTEVRKDGIYYMLNQRNSWDKLECKESQCYLTKEEAIKGNDAKENHEYANEDLYEAESENGYTE